MAVREGQLIAITSVKGGVGKTTFLLNLAVAFKDKRVLIVDFDLSGSAIAASLNKEFKYDLFDLFDDVEHKRFNQLGEYVVKYNDQIDFIAAPKDPRKSLKLNINLLNLVFYQFKVKYDIILIDTNHNIDKTNLLIMDLVNQIIFLTTPNLIDLKNLRTMLNIYKNMEKTNYKIVLNRAKDKHKDDYDDTEVRALLNHNIDYVLGKDCFQNNFEKDLLMGKIGYSRLKNKKVYQQMVKALEVGVQNEKIS